LKFEPRVPPESRAARRGYRRFIYCRFTYRRFTYRRFIYCRFTYRRFIYRLTALPPPHTLPRDSRNTIAWPIRCATRSGSGSLDFLKAATSSRSASTRGAPA
jgi:hypothetical protein